MFDYVEIVSSIVAALTAGGWLLSRHKRTKESEEHEAKIKALEAKITASLRDSETKYTREALEIYTDNVVKPLRDEIRILRENQIQFLAAINLAPTCVRFPDCVVIKQLRSATKDSHHTAERSDEDDGHDDFDSCAIS